MFQANLFGSYQSHTYALLPAFFYFTLPICIVKHIENDSENDFTVGSSLLDPKELRQQGHMAVDFITDYYENIEKYPVMSQVEPGYLRLRLPESAPSDPESIEKILQDVQTHIIPGITHWQSPNFFAYFAASGSIANFVGEILSTGFNVVGFNWLASPAATELEQIVMDWLAKSLKLPSSYHFSGGGGGVIHGYTCEAFVCTLNASREKMLKEIGVHNAGKLVVYSSDQTHFSLQKAAKTVGFLPGNIRAIKTYKHNNFELCPSDLESAIKLDLEVGLVPMYLCTTIGTTSSTAVDPLGSLCQVAKAYHIWVHIDAAYAGNACICPEFRHFLNGVELADSFSFNAHKWFLTSLDCCCLWVKEPNALIEALSTQPEILSNEATESKNVVDYKDWQIALSRRFRSLKLWLVLRSYGVDKIRAYIRGHVEMAKHFEGLVLRDKRFEVVVPRHFSMVCFRISPSAIYKDGTLVGGDEVNNINKKLYDSVNNSGQLYMTHTFLEGIYVIRFAVGSTLTELRHIIGAWEVIQEYANSLLGSRDGSI